MDRDDLIKVLEENNLLEVLLGKIYYINYPRYRKVIGKSLYLDYLERVELHFNTTYYIDGYDFFKEEDQQIIFDEYNCLKTQSKTPIDCYIEKKLTIDGLKRLIRILPEDKLMVIRRKLNLSKCKLENLANGNIEFPEQATINIEKNKNDMAVITKSINDIQIGLLTLVSVMGEQITKTDMQNVDKIIKKATSHLEQLNQEIRNEENNQQYSLKLK